MNAPGAKHAGITVTALLLAGGLSSRMGRDKATMILEGRPLWERQLELMRRLKPDALWISARQAPSWAPADIPVLCDAPPSAGPLSGIALALEKMATTHLLVLAIDLPRMTVEHLARLVDYAEPGRGAIVRSEDHFEPLSAVYPKQAAPIAQRALAKGDWSLQSLAETLLREGLLKEHRLSESETALYLNLNTPADLPNGLPPAPDQR